MSRAPASVTPLAQQGGGHPIEPDFASFARRYDEGVPQVAWTRLVADLETPVSAMLKLAHERPKVAQYHEQEPSDPDAFALS